MNFAWGDPINKSTPSSKMPNAFTEAAQNVPALAFIGWPLVPFLPRPQSQLLTYATWIKNIDVVWDVLVVQLHPLSSLVKNIDLMDMKAAD